jgi:hypothetical protein
LTYEDLRTDLAEQAKKVLIYALNRVTKIFNGEQQMHIDVFKMLAGLMFYWASQTDNSPTFRKGNIGDWREHFTEEHKQRFKDSDTNNWLIKLGYEKDGNW